MAWLNAELEGDVSGTRADLLNEANPLKKLPNVIIAPYLLQYSLELGLFKNGQMGLAPIDWIDIQAWVNLTGLDIHPEEVRILKDLSCVYIGQLGKSKKIDCSAPYQEENTPEVKCANIKSQMAQFRRKHKK